MYGESKTRNQKGRKDCMKKFLLIGAGIGQVFIAKKIKQRGHYLVVIAYNSIPEVINLADKFIHQDLFDYEKVLDIAKCEKIEAVVSDQHDIIAPLVAYIAEKMNLPGNSFDALNSYCNKNIFRDNCDLLNIPVPKHIRVTDLIVPSVFMNNSFPWIVKPADSQSSIGVKKVSSVDECLDAIKDALLYSRTNSAIVEEFFEGKEVVAEGFIWNGNYYNLGFADRKYFNIVNAFIPSQTIFPSLVKPDILNKIIECESAMAKYVSPKFAIVHSEYLYNESGEIRVVESALRGGGVYISSHLIPLYSGIDINDILLDAAEGQEVNFDMILQSRVERSSAYVCFSLPEGVVESIKGVEEIQSRESVCFADFSMLNVGMKTLPMTHKGQRLGPIIISAQNRTELESEIAIIQDILKVKMENSKDINNSVIWD